MITGGLVRAFSGFPMARVPSEFEWQVSGSDSCGDDYDSPGRRSQSSQHSMGSGLEAVTWKVKFFHQKSFQKMLGRLWVFFPVLPFFFKGGLGDVCDRSIQKPQTLFLIWISYYFPEKKHDSLWDHWHAFFFGDLVN